MPGSPESENSPSNVNLNAVIRNAQENIGPILSLLKIPIERQMDPRLQRLGLRSRFGLRETATSSSSAEEINVVARVTDTAAWEAMSEVRPGMIIGDEENGTKIVTARIPIKRISYVREQDCVESLKAAQGIRPTLDASVVETAARPQDWPDGTSPENGEGVVVGIVDYGCDFAHENFRNADGSTRLEWIWDQDGTPGPNDTTVYGREYGRDEINAALSATGQSSYDALGYAPRPDSPAQTGTHGTHVMDIAAGNGLGTQKPGFAPHASLIFVDVSHHDIPFHGSNVVNASFGDSVMLLEAVTYIFEKAGERPCVVNISLGTNGGPKDGTTLVEEGLDRLLRARPNRAITISASNSYDDGIHAGGTLNTGDTADLVWEVPVVNQTHDELELWYAGDDRIAVELLLPDGTSIGTVEPGDQAVAADPAGDILLVVNRLGDPNNNDNQIGIFLKQGLPAGQWTVRLHARAVAGDGRFHAWIERDNRSPSRFAAPTDDSHTLGSISTGHETIVVGSYDAHKATTPLSWFTSAGPTRDGRQKPEISAPGHRVAAAHSRTGSGAVTKSGTSMAAPAVAGIVALLLAEAVRQDTALSIGDLRRILMDTARRNPPPGDAWHDRFGFGRIDASAALQAVVDLAEERREAG